MKRRARRLTAQMGLTELPEREMKKGTPESSSGPTTQDEDRVRMLAALLFANLGGTATLQESGHGQLSIAMPDGPIFTIKLDKDRATLGGSPTSPNLDQFLGSFDDEDSEIRALSQISENAVTLIQEAMESEDPPSPVFYKGLAEKPQQDDPEEDSQDGNLAPAPGTEQSPDELMDQAGPDAGGAPPGGPGMGAPPGGPDMGMGGMPGGQHGMDMGMGAPPGGPPGMPPGPPMGGMPQPPMQPPMPQGMPMASKRAIASAFDDLADQLQKKGLKRLAARVDRLANTFERRTKRR